MLVLGSQKKVGESVVTTKDRMAMKKDMKIMVVRKEICGAEKDLKERENTGNYRL